MKTLNKNLLSILLVLCVLMSTIFPSFAETQSAQTETKEFKGWILDWDCVGANPLTHTTACLKMDSCITSGLGILIYNPDTTYQNYTWVPFDVSSQSQGSNLINSIPATQKNNVSIRVFGNEVDGVPASSDKAPETDPSKVTSTVNGIHVTSIELYVLSSPSPTSAIAATSTISTPTATPTATVTSTPTAVTTPTSTPAASTVTTTAATATPSITAATTPSPAATTSQITEFKGYLIDEDCSGVAKPENHTTSCLKMPSCIASGLGILVRQTDGTYKFLRFDANGHNLAKDIIFSTIKENNVTIKVTGAYDGTILTVSTIGEDLNAPSPTPFTDIIGALYTNAEGAYGINLEQPDGSNQSYLLDENGNQLVKEVIRKTTQQKNILVKAKGAFEGSLFKTVKVEDYQEFYGYIASKNSFINFRDPSKVTKEFLLTDESAASGYGIAVKLHDGNYTYYKFNDEFQSTIAKTIKKAEAGSSILYLVYGPQNGGVIQVLGTNYVRNIPGLLVTRKFADEDKPLKDITRSDLVSPEYEASGYGYFVNSCGGYEYFPFDHTSRSLIKDVISKSKSTGKIKINVKGFYYWRDRTVKVVSVSEDTTLQPEPVEKEIKGIISTRKFYIDNKVQQGVLGITTRDYLLNPENIASGYGIIYKPCCRYGFYKLDEKGVQLVKDIIRNTSQQQNINVIVRAVPDENYLYVSSIVEDLAVPTVPASPAPTPTLTPTPSIVPSALPSLVDSVITGKDTIAAGQELTLYFGLRNITKNSLQVLKDGIYSLDVKIGYDPDIFDLTGVVALNNGIGIAGQDIGTPGTIRLLLASQGQENAIKEGRDLVKLVLKAKAFSKSTDVSITQAVAADGTGVEYSVKLYHFLIPVTTTVQGDLNGDGKVSLGDIAIVAASYRKNSSAPDWESIRIADVNQDGIIGVEDLVFVASKILEK